MKKTDWLIIFIGILLTIFFTNPLIYNLDTYYPKNQDFMFFDWLFQYNYRALADGLLLSLSKYYNSNQFYPLPSSLVLADIVLIPSFFIYTPIYFFTHNNIVSLNLTIIISFLFTFVSAYYAIDYLIKSKISSLFGSVVFTFSPVIFARFFSGHIEYLQRYFIPPLMISSFLFFRRPNLKRGFIFSLFFLLSWLTNIQLTIFSSLFLAFYFIYFLLKRFKEGRFKIWTIDLIKNGVITLTPTLTIIIFLYNSYLNFSIKEAYWRSLESVSQFGAKIEDFFIGNPQQFLFGGLYDSLTKFREKDPGGFFYFGEHTLFFGFIVYFVILFSYFFIKKSKEEEKNLFIALFLIGVIFALGPFLKIGDFIIKMPYFYLYENIFIFKATRTPTRIMLVAAFFLSFVFALTVKQIAKNKSLKSKLLLGVIFIFLLTEYKQLIYIETYQPSFLNYNLSDKKVMFWPLETEDEQSYLYLKESVKGNFIMVNGAIGSYLSGYSYITERLNNIKPFEDTWFTILQTLNIDFLVINLKEKRNTNWLQFQSIMNIIKKPEINRLVVYEHQDWLVLDIKKHIGKNCFSDKVTDLVIKATLVNNNDYSNSVARIDVKNPSRCHLRFFFDKRYQSINYEIIGKKKKERHNMHLKFPPFLLSQESFSTIIEVSRPINQEETIKILNIN
ncbi:conserved membrane hypothetical protein [Candidatus Roizmanbacteria bacterium]|nr:conserved membrane hypothetical protein [Candidatus Roizmanbacteria bacterium]